METRSWVTQLAIRPGILTVFKKDVTKQLAKRNQG
jgi:hypothetical protein